MDSLKTTVNSIGIVIVDIVQMLYWWLDIFPLVPKLCLCFLRYRFEADLAEICA